MIVTIFIAVSELPIIHILNSLVAMGLKQAEQDKDEKLRYNESIVSVSARNSYAISGSAIEPDEIKNDEAESSPELLNSIDDLISKIKIKYEITDIKRQSAAVSPADEIECNMELLEEDNIVYENIDHDFFNSFSALDGNILEVLLERNAY